MAQIDVNAINKELKKFIQQEVDCKVKEFVNHLIQNIVSEKIDVIPNIIENTIGQKFAVASNEIKAKVGATYIQWGRSTCTANDSEIVYSGFVGGSAYTNSGSAVNNLCLPSHPQWGTYDTKDNNHPFVGAALFDLFDINVPNTVFDFDKYDHNRVACSLCRKKLNTATMMIPARQDCYGDWVKLYDGYLYAGWHAHESASEFICMDSKPDVLDKGSTWTHKKILYPVKANCDGAMPCPPYVNGREVTCVVCSK